MQSEIEAVFTGIDKAELRGKLEGLGAELVQAERKMRRTIFDTGVRQYARVRDEGDKVTMTYKRFDDETITGAKEVNVVVDDYDRAVAFLEGCGLERKARQETLRETWRLDGVEVDIDTWPWLPAFVEVEGPTVEETVAVCEKLGFEMKDAIYGAVDEVYVRYYDVTRDDINNCPEIVFGEVPEWLEGKRRG